MRRFKASRWFACLLVMVASCAVPSFEFQDSGDSGTPTPCSNQVLDEGEADVDCGGVCPACGYGKACTTNPDCAQGMCINGICQDASCSDQLQNGGESDIDCGGKQCAACVPGKACVQASDCDSGVCTKNVCAAPSCKDKSRNGAETDIDCGGSACPACEAGKRCSSGKDCEGGKCVAATCALVCLEGKADCDGMLPNGCETNLKTDPLHCSACDAPCKLANATASCSGGKCLIATCKAPFEDCDGDPTNGCEVDTSTDKDNCSACHKACTGVNGTPGCADSKCTIDCDDGFADCDMKPENGCEKNVGNDVNNCGKCGAVCEAGNGTPWCVKGKCGISSCPTGLGDCNGDPKDGCEVDLTSDTKNCKTCGNLCVAANGTAKCQASACKIGSCNPGFADCNAATPDGYGDGCEKDTNTDASNCGKCGTVCTISNATAKCDTGACKVKTCSPPFADCDGDGLTCEINTSSNAANCGGCGKTGVDCNAVYNPLNATGKCVSSGCALDKCAANFQDCNKKPDVDGCEANLKTDEANCGVCGTQCLAPHGTNTCTSGLCVPGCGTQFGDCDGSVNSGCEAVFASDDNNCGSCGLVCQDKNATNACNGSGACSPDCNANFQDCDSNPANGCESNKLSDPKNCGGCNSVCVANHASSNVCTSGTCNPSCLNGFKDCDANPKNGCEQGVFSDPNNCGDCDVVCKTANATGTSCSASGACQPQCNSGWGACSNPENGCTVSLDTAAHCGACLTSCVGTANPFCISRVCKHNLDIVLVNSDLFDTAGNVGASLTLSHALQTAKGNYRLVMVGVTVQGGSAAAAQPMSVSYAGFSMHLAPKSAWSGDAWSGVYYALDAELPATTGSKTVLVAAGSPSGSYIITAHVIEFKNVDQVTPIDGSGSGTGGNCSGSTPSATAAVSAAGEWAYGVAALYGAASTATGPQSTGQTTVVQSSAGTLGALMGYKGPVSTSTTFSWNANNCTDWAETLVTIAPATHP